MRLVQAAFICSSTWYNSHDHAAIIMESIRMMNRRRWNVKCAQTEASVRRILTKRLLSGSMFVETLENTLASWCRSWYPVISQCPMPNTWTLFLCEEASILIGCGCAPSLDSCEVVCLRASAQSPICIVRIYIAAHGRHHIIVVAPAPTLQLHTAAEGWSCHFWADLRLSCFLEHNYSRYYACYTFRSVTYYTSVTANSSLNSLIIVFPLSVCLPPDAIQRVHSGHSIS